MPEMLINTEAVYRQSQQMREAIWVQAKKGKPKEGKPKAKLDCTLPPYAVRRA